MVANKKNATKKTDLDKAIELLEDLPEQYNKNPRIIESPKVLAALKVVYEKTPVVFDRIIDGTKGIRRQSILRQIKVSSEKTSDSAIKRIGQRIPTWIKEHHFITVSDTEKIYYYGNGVYLDDGETLLKALIESEFGDITTENVVRDVMGKIKRRTYITRDKFDKDKNIINVKNGLLNIETMELKPHSPDHFSLSQLNVAYDPDAKAPKIREFLDEVALPEDVPLIEELIGWFFHPEYNVHVAVMLLGIGRNGKGTLLRLITAFIGNENVSNVTLQDIALDKFATADLFGKLANIGGDLPAKDLSDTAGFRNLTGGDDKRAQEKFRAPFNFRNTAKMWFSANMLPRSPDDTYAFYSRWILIEFLQRYSQKKNITDGAKTADPDLDKKLQTPEELSGLLNIALDGLKRLKDNAWKFSYNKTG